MPAAPRADVTQLLLAHGRGEAGAFGRLMGAVYADLHRIAGRELRRRHGQTLNPTGLVHEVYLKLIDASRVSWQDRAHFFGIAANAMRQILVDHARARASQKRGGGLAHTDLEGVDVALAGQAEEVLAVHQALGRLAELDPRLVKVVECRYFAGLTEEETAEVMDTSPRTARRDWLRARAWLREALGLPPAGAADSSDA